MRILCFAASLILALVLTGCQVSKPYILKTDRVDQNTNIGNRGYLKGQAPALPDRGDLKRPLIAVDIDFPEIKGSQKSGAGSYMSAEPEKKVSAVREVKTAVVQERPVIKPEEDMK